MAKLKKGSAAAKAWGRRMQRARSGLKPSHSSIKMTSSTMARRKRRTRRSYPRYAKRRSSRRSSGMGVLGSALIGGVGVAVAEPFIEKFTSGIGLGIPDDILKVGVGYFAAKQSNKYIRETGKALIYLGVARLVTPLASSLIGKVTGSTTANNNGATVI